MSSKNKNFHLNENGSSLVSAMLVLSLLALISMVISNLAINERKSVHLDEVNTRAIFAADSGGEVAIADLRNSNRPKAILDLANLIVTETDNSPFENPDFSDEYAFRVEAPATGFMEARPGYSGGYYDFHYNIEALGIAGDEGSSQIEVDVTRLYKLGYQ